MRHKTYNVYNITILVVSALVISFVFVPFDKIYGLTGRKIDCTFKWEHPPRLYATADDPIGEVYTVPDEIIYQALKENKDKTISVSEAYKRIVQRKGYAPYIEYQNKLYWIIPFFVKGDAVLQQLKAPVIVVVYDKQTGKWSYFKDVVQLPVLTLSPPVNTFVNGISMYAYGAKYKNNYYIIIPLYIAGTVTKDNLPKLVVYKIQGPWEQGKGFPVQRVAYFNQALYPGNINFVFLNNNIIVARGENYISYNNKTDKPFIQYKGYIALFYLDKGQYEIYDFNKMRDVSVPIVNENSVYFVHIPVPYYFDPLQGQGVIPTPIEMLLASQSKPSLLPRYPVLFKITARSDQTATIQFVRALPHFPVLASKIYEKYHGKSIGWPAEWLSRTRVVPVYYGKGYTIVAYSLGYSTPVWGGGIYYHGNEWYFGILTTTFPYFIPLRDWKPFSIVLSPTLNKIMNKSYIREMHDIVWKNNMIVPLFNLWTTFYSVRPGVSGDFGPFGDSNVMYYDAAHDKIVWFGVSIAGTPEGYGMMGVSYKVPETKTQIEQKIDKKDADTVIQIRLAINQKFAELEKIEKKNAEMYAHQLPVLFDHYGNPIWLRRNYAEHKEIVLDTAPLIYKNRTLVPLRFLAEQAGYKVSWIPQGKYVLVSQGNTTIKLQINNKTYWVNGKKYMADVEPLIYKNRTLVPLRIIVEALKGNVYYAPLRYSMSINHYVIDRFEGCYKYFLGKFKTENDVHLVKGIEKQFVGEKRKYYLYQYPVVQIYLKRR